jgi:lipopolysaccharide biosynthesis protein
MSGNRRVCLFAQFHPQARIRGHVVHYVGALQACGFQTVVAISGDRWPPYEDRKALTDTGATLVFRPNRGLDFGAWRDLIREGHADGADTVLLANDSVFGPYRPLQPIIDRMRRYDVWGMIESEQHGWHLQSWFLHFTGEAFRNPEIARVFDQPFGTMSKDEIIQGAELGLGRALRKTGLRCGAVVRTRDATWMARRHPLNLMHVDWRYNLLTGRLPFIKADLIRTNLMNLPWAVEWERVLRERLGVDTGPISDYLYEYTGKTRPAPDAPYHTPVRKVPLGFLAAYMLASHDRRMAWRGFLNGLKSEMFTSNG